MSDIQLDGPTTLPVSGEKYFCKFENDWFSFFSYSFLCITGSIPGLAAMISDICYLLLGVYILVEVYFLYSKSRYGWKIATATKINQLNN